MAGILEACLKEARDLHAVLQDAVVSPKDGCATRAKKILKGLRKRGLIEARSESIERWKGLLVLCISEINSTNLYTTQVSVGNSYALTANTSSNVRKLVDTLPPIFTQLTAMEIKLQDLTSRMNATSGAAVATPGLTRNLEHVLQNLMSSQPSAVLRSNFGTNLLTHYLVPSSRNKSFPCFGDTMKKLKQLYLSGTRSTERTLTLAGVPCGGKTRTAVEFCRQAEKEAQFGAIFWITSSSTTAIRKSFQEMANNLNVDKSHPYETMIKVIMGILSAWPCRWLMVIDNYIGPDINKDLQDFMPQSQQGAYLLTRRLESLTPMEKNSAILLPQLQLSDALELLFNSSAVEKTDENYEQGLKLFRELGKTPKVIMGAGSYIKKHKIDFEDYYRIRQESDSGASAVLLEELKVQKTQKM